MLLKIPIDSAKLESIGEDDVRNALQRGFQTADEALVQRPDPGFLISLVNRRIFLEKARDEFFAYLPLDGYKLEFLMAPDANDIEDSNFVFVLRRPQDEAIDVPREEIWSARTCRFSSRVGN